MTSTRTCLRGLAAIAVIALIAAAAGCSNDSGEKSSAANAKDGSSASGSQPDSHAQAARFAQCMRDNGVSEFPDPDASGRLTIDGVLNGSSLDPSSSAWQTAIDACEDLQPPGFTGPDEVSDSQQQARLDYAECMRDNGVSDFPDPGKGDPLVDTNRIPSAATASGMSALNSAMQQCGDAAAAAGVEGP